MMRPIDLPFSAGELTKSGAAWQSRVNQGGRDAQRHDHSR
jgi:hypothetical protein